MKTSYIFHVVLKSESDKDMKVLEEGFKYFKDEFGFIIRAKIGSRESAHYMPNAFFKNICWLSHLPGESAEFYLKIYKEIPLDKIEEEIAKWEYNQQDRIK